MKAILTDSSQSIAEQKDTKVVLRMYSETVAERNIYIPNMFIRICIPHHSHVLIV
jgi:hypothetical protein